MDKVRITLPDYFDRVERFASQRLRAAAQAWRNYSHCTDAKRSLAYLGDIRAYLTGAHLCLNRAIEEATLAIDKEMEIK